MSNKTFPNWEQGLASSANAIPSGMGQMGNVSVPSPWLQGAQQYNNPLQGLSQITQYPQPWATAPLPGRDFTHKTYYSGIMEMVIALCEQHGVLCRLLLPPLEVQIELEVSFSIDPFEEVVVALTRDGETIELGFDTICALAPDEMAQFIEVNCSLLPKPIPSVEEDEYGAILQQALVQSMQQTKMQIAQQIFARQAMAMPSPPLVVSAGSISFPPQGGLSEMTGNEDGYFQKKLKELVSRKKK